MNVPPRKEEESRAYSFLERGRKVMPPVGKGIRDMASNSALHLKVQTPWCQTFKVDVYNPLQYKEHWAYSVLSLYGMYSKQFAVPWLIPQSLGRSATLLQFGEWPCLDHRRPTLDATSQMLCAQSSNQYWVGVPF